MIVAAEGVHSKGRQFSGVFAALLCPRRSDGSLDAAALTRLVQFLMSKGVQQFAVNGATGEFCSTRAEELPEILKIVRAASEGQARILCGVGTTSITSSVRLTEIAGSGGADGLLLPMPYFFRYGQDDLGTFCREVALRTNLPILLYNLPQFSSGVDLTTAQRLIEDVPNIVGIKDSGGSLEILRGLSERAVTPHRFVGNDKLLRNALSEGVCDGIISGIACVLPELILKLYSLGGRAGESEFDAAWWQIDTVAAKLDEFPAPWGLKFIAEARGLAPATFLQGISEEKLARGRAIKEWLDTLRLCEVNAGA